MKNTSSHQTTAKRQIPLRSCVACKQVKGKKEMVRLVLDRDGTPEIDVTGKKEGRGTYICPAQECWDRAFKENHLERALRRQFSNETREQLKQQGRKLLREMNVAEGD